MKVHTDCSCEVAHWRVHPNYCYVPNVSLFIYLCLHMGPSFHRVRETSGSSGLRVPALAQEEASMILLTCTHGSMHLPWLRGESGKQTKNRQDREMEREREQVSSLKYSVRTAAAEHNYT